MPQPAQTSTTAPAANPQPDVNSNAIAQSEIALLGAIALISLTLIIGARLRRHHQRNSIQYQRDRLERLWKQTATKNYFD